ncbi:DUF2076 domain-containing protein [Devosia sp.]|uniref:DUF2076 domain-containing protein n=1 Tax=Devosia sp. TaxID=1871048 RepID=UPI003A8DA190
MLNPEDRRAIEGLFDRLASVEASSQVRDADAEQFIRDEIARQPAAPYYMAQTILVQEQALETAQRRIAELEAAARAPAPAQRARGPWDRDETRSGGGFLAGAAQTALGVTGGMMLGSLIGSMFGSSEAQAVEPMPESAPEPTDAGGDDTDMGGDDFGGFDGGGFDFGGDF